MQQKSPSLMKFQKPFGTEKTSQKYLFCLLWPQSFRCTRWNHDQVSFHSTRRLYQLIGMDVTTTGKAMVVVGVETPAEKPRFADMRVVPRDSREEIQFLVLDRLETEAVIQTDGWKGYSIIDAPPNLRHKWMVPGS
jgi:hypothetical protein